MEKAQRITTELNKLVDQIVEDTATQIVKNGVNPEVATRRALKLLADKISELLKGVISASPSNEAKRRETIG